MSKKTIGILGGMGPLATADLFKKIVLMTKAERDNDHIRIYIDDNSSIPDRTGCILRGGENPLPYMRDSLKKLECCGADCIIMPCNTAHYFYDMLTDAIDIPFLNIMEETAAYLDDMGVKKAGVMATEGTVSTKTYNRYLEAHGIECITPDEKEQGMVTDIIYGDIKLGKRADMEKLNSVAESLFKKGAKIGANPKN